MTPNLGQRFLKLIAPKFEDERIKYRLEMARRTAIAEDVSRTISKMNGHAADLWNPKKSCKP